MARYNKQLPNGEIIPDVKLPAQILNTGHQIAAEQTAPAVGTMQQVRAVAEYQAAIAQAQGFTGAPPPGALQGPYPDVPPEIATAVLPAAHPLPGSNLPVIQPQQQAPVQYAQPQSAAYPPGYPAPSGYAQPQYQEPQYQQASPYPQPAPPVYPQPAAPYQGQMGQSQINPYPQPIAQPNMPQYPPPIGYQAPQQMQAPPYGAQQQARYAPQPPQPQYPQPQVMGTGQQAMILQPNNPGSPPPPSTVQEYLRQQGRMLQGNFPEVTDILQGKVPGQVAANQLPAPQRPQLPQPLPPQQIEITHKYENVPRSIRATRPLGAYVFGDFMDIKCGQIISDPSIIEELIRGGAGDSFIEVTVSNWVTCPSCGQSFPPEAGTSEYVQEHGRQQLNNY